MADRPQDRDTRLHLAAGDKATVTLNNGESLVVRREHGDAVVIGFGCKATCRIKWPHATTFEFRCTLAESEHRRVQVAPDVQVPHHESYDSAGRLLVWWDADGDAEFEVTRA